LEQPSGNGGANVPGVGLGWEWIPLDGVGEWLGNALDGALGSLGGGVWLPTLQPTVALW
jgi:hypothetical protein